MVSIKKEKDELDVVVNSETEVGRLKLGGQPKLYNETLSKKKKK